ncbi:MAG: prepilin-type N-terminal cleavage/methylation domain-containing protein [Nitrososphaeria archaeon]
MKRKERAFTLIELMVVIGIIIVLVSVSVPAYGYMQSRAKVASVSEDVQNIGKAIVAFKSDWGQFPPSSYDALKSELTASSGATVNITGKNTMHGDSAPIQYLDSSAFDAFEKKIKDVSYSSSGDSFTLSCTVESMFGDKVITLKDGVLLIAGSSGGSGGNNGGSGSGNSSSLSVSISGPTTVLGDTDVNFTANVSGGTPPYTYNWSFSPANAGSITSPLNVPSITMYISYEAQNIVVNVTVVDSQGNQANSSISVVRVDDVVITSIQGPTSGVVGTSYSYLVNFTGGFPPYEIYWSYTGPVNNYEAGQGNPCSLSFPVAGTYTVYATVCVSGSSSCFTSMPYTVHITTSSPSLVVSLPSNYSIYMDSMSMTIDVPISVSGGSGNYTYSWNITSRNQDAPTPNPASGSVNAGSNYVLSVTFFKTIGSVSEEYDMFVTVTDRNTGATSSASCVFDFMFD